jgi:hypothetical protein
MMPDSGGASGSNVPTHAETQAGSENTPMLHVEHEESMIDALFRLIEGPEKTE